MQVTKKILEKNINNKQVLKGLLLGKVQINNKKYGYISYNNEKVLIPEDKISERELRDPIGALIGAEISFLVEKYDEDLNAYIGNRNSVKDVLEKLLEKKDIKIGDKFKVTVIVVAKDYIIVEFYGEEIRIKNKYLENGWIEDARNSIKLGDIKEVEIVELEPRIKFKVVAKEKVFEADKYKIGDEYLAKVIGIPDFGIVTKIDDDREVLCYKVDWREDIKIGDYVIIQINDVKQEEKRTYGFLKRRVRR